MRLDRWLTLWLGALLLVSAVPGQLAAQSVRIDLPRGVSIELPAGWTVLSGQQRIQLDTLVQLYVDLSGLERSSSELPFAANLYDSDLDVIALVNLRYYPTETVSQAMIRNASPEIVKEMVKEVDSGVRQGIEKGYEKIEMDLVAWLGTSLVSVNGITALVSEYRRRRAGSSESFDVRLVRVFAGDRSFTLTVSHRHSDEATLRPVTDRIIESLRMGQAPGP